ncbi:hypothetical protein GCM10010967_38790 [Dyadobacter beijingensis]|uniref:DUF5672 domain-containing protein n=1 Tax=Dyadobacter beijingensis TaxID=365489 RepID=A0ABQ2I697_9BACT|nr:DUF5672 family protein [Dyadobacter beijingensis]GGN00740.1 hypothetical protein GCM10010967_38790 [Dyadobacter beijingensis]
MKELVTVIIPILETQITPTEEKILHHALQVLSEYPIIFVAGEGADLSVVREHAEQIDVVHFPKRYFESRQHLGQLFLMADFYDRFNWCDFLLIHELNSWVIKDELHYWCKQGYDYIKAPSFLPVANAPGMLKRISGLSDEEKRVFGSGYADNGLYLCRIERMTGVLKSKKKPAHAYRHDAGLPNADSVFWELEPNRLWPHLRKPTDVVRSHFVQYGVQYENKGILPFALTGISGANIREIPYFKTLPETE